MNITLLTYGSRGDVQPFVALALGLRQAGHTVTLAAPHRFAGWIARHGITCVPLAGDPDDLSRQLNTAGYNPLRMVRALYRHAMSVAPAVVRAAWQALRGAEAVVHSFAFTAGAHSWARALHIPDISVQLFPMFAPTRAFAAPGLPAGLPGWLNALSHMAFTQVFWYASYLGYVQLRRRASADLPARLYWPFRPAPPRPLTPLILAFSPAVTPTPPDWRAAHIHQTGYLFLDAPAEPPPAELTDFLARGPAPVCVTFGSMVNRAAVTLTQAGLAALQRTGQRGVFITGWGGWRPPAPPPHTCFVEAAPLHELLPQCAVVVHHGGAGTTAAGLRAGVPAVVIPHTADQPFWGARVAALGAGPRPLTLHTVTADTLAQALTEALSPAVRQRAAAVAARLHAEDGVRQAVAVIEQHIQRFPALTAPA